MTGRIVSVNLGTPQTVPMQGRERFTAIHKHPVNRPVRVGPMGLEGDGVGSPKHHGGPGQAVYAYASEDYEWWADQVDVEVGPGVFGENLTTEGIDLTGTAIGDRLVVGTATLEVTAPRIPCGTLAARMMQGQFVGRFKDARRPGAYLRVIEEGVVEPGDDVRLEPADDRGFGLMDLWDLTYDRSPTIEAMQTALRYPIADRARASFEEAVAQAQS